jgi:hypothetical protein
MVDPNWLKTSAGVKMPRIIYGIVVKAIQTGFRGIDTACQPKHSSDTLIKHPVFAIPNEGANLAFEAKAPRVSTLRPCEENTWQ